MIAEKNMIAEFVELGINGHNEDDILDYMLEVLGHGFVYYNYVNNVKKSKLRRKERRIAKKNAYEYEIRFKNDLVGKFVFNLPEKALSEEEKEAVKSAGNVILLMNKEKISVEIEEKDLKQEFVLDICTGNLKTREEFNIRNRLNGWDIKEHAAVVIFDLDEFKKKTVDLDGNGKEVEIVKEKMFRGLKKAFLDADLIFYNYQNSDSIIFLFEANAAYKKNREAVFSKVMKTSETEYGFTYTVGLGRTVDNIFDVPVSYKEAREAIRVGRGMLGLGLIHEYKDLELFSVLNKAVSKDMLTGELMSPIRRIIDYDGKNETEYYAFLKELINANWSLTKASENNYIHYNTAKYRLKKMEEIMELQIEDANSRFKLELALRLYELKKMV